MSFDAPTERGAHRWITFLILLSVIGIADSGYLLWMHGRSALSTGRRESAFCPANACDTVNQGNYAEIGGVPIAAFGLGAYLTLLGLSVLAAALKGRHIVKAIGMLSGVGVSVSAYLIYVQGAVIRAICSWCIVSALTMLSIFVVSLVWLRAIRPASQRAPARQEAA